MFKNSKKCSCICKKCSWFQRMNSFFWIWWTYFDHRWSNLAFDEQFFLIWRTKFVLEKCFWKNYEQNFQNANTFWNSLNNLKTWFFLFVNIFGKWKFPNIFLIFDFFRFELFFKKMGEHFWIIFFHQLQKIFVLLRNCEFF